MKIHVPIIIAAFLCGCAGNKKADFAAVERESAIDLTSRYIGFVERKYAKIKPAKISPDGAVRSLEYSYCLGKEFSKDKYLALLGQNCTLQGGSMIQNKWCVDGRKNTIKFLLEVDNKNLKYQLQPDEMFTCPSSDTRLDIYIKEYVVPKSTDNVGVVSCQRVPIPAELRKKGQVGSVKLAITVSPEGGVIGSRVEETSGSPIIDELGMRQYARCVFIPKIQNGVAVSETQSFLATYKTAD